MLEFISNYAGLIGLISFFTIFISIIFWVIKPERKQKIEAHKHIPFEVVMELKKGSKNVK